MMDCSAVCHCAGRSLNPQGLPNEEVAHESPHPNGCPLHALGPRLRVEFIANEFPVRFHLYKRVLQHRFRVVERILRSQLRELGLEHRVFKRVVNRGIVRQLAGIKLGKLVRGNLRVGVFQRVRNEQQLRSEHRAV